MCTLSWIPSRRGYWLLFNRDENVLRAPGLPPRRGSAGRIRYLSPTDGDFGGTWIGVNSLGITLAMLNRYGDPVDPSDGPKISRGSLIRSLLNSASLKQTLDRLAGLDLRHYRPFTLAATAPRRAVHLLDWNGQTLERSAVDQPGIVRVSSAVDFERADQARREALRELASGRHPTPATLRALHRSHLPSRGPLSACMHRDDASSVSHTEIRVSPGRATMRHWAGSPCTSRTLTVNVLPFR